MRRVFEETLSSNKHDPHKFPTYKIKNNSTNKNGLHHHKHSLSIQMSSLIKNNSTTFSKGKLPQHFFNRNSYSKINKTSQGSSSLHLGIASQDKAETSPVFDKQASKPYLNLGYLRKNTNNGNLSPSLNEKEAELRFYSARLGSKQKQQLKEAKPRDSGLQKQPKKPAFLQNSRTMNRPEKNLKINKENPKNGELLFTPLLTKLPLHENLFDDNSMKYSVGDESQLSETSEVIATHREMADQNGWLPTSLTNHIKLVDSYIFK